MLVVRQGRAAAVGSHRASSEGQRNCLGTQQARAGTPPQEGGRKWKTPALLFVAVLCTVAKIQNQPEVEKGNAVCMLNGILFNQKKERSAVICSNIDEPGGPALGEISQAQKEAYLSSHSCVENAVMISKRRVEQGPEPRKGMGSTGGRVGSRLQGESAVTFHAQEGE